MTGREVVERLSDGYRMPKPSTNPPCPDSFYEIMLQCWKAEEMDRPTFEHLSVRFYFIIITS